MVAATPAKERKRAATAQRANERSRAADTASGPILLSFPGPGSLHWVRGRSTRTARSVLVVAAALLRERLALLRRVAAALLLEELVELAALAQLVEARLQRRGDDEY